MEHHETLYIGGGRVRPSTSDVIVVVNPSTEEKIGEVPSGGAADVDAAVRAARAAFDAQDGWAAWEPARRADVLDRLADELEKRADDMARLVSSQNGMPISMARGLEGEYPVTVLRYYAELTRSASWSRVEPGRVGGTTEVRRVPLGVVAAIVPWNFPQVLASFKIGGALAAGCTVVLKPSPETVLDSYVLAEAAEAAGVPDGVLNIVPGGREAGAHLVSQPGVDKVAFTGSTAAGRSIGETCGRLLRPVTLELGGKSAGIILDDADLRPEAIAQELVPAMIVNNGQTCFISSRILAPRSRYEEVVDLVTGLASSLPVGDALDPATVIGPMATEAQRDKVESYIAKGRADGFRVTTGGGRPAHLDRGWFVEPTVFADVDNSSVLAQEEIFGPVLCVIPYDTVDDAVALANDSDYGLAGTVWSADQDRAAAVARRIHTGTIGVNRYLPDPGAPFGGWKASGMGSELGPEGMEAYLHIQTLYR
ncbi:MAG: aldehyde dehydrogenase [Aeromicrobium sp.]